MQFYGGDNLTVENSRFYRCANPQALFFGQDQNGTFSNIVVQNNMIGQCIVAGCDTGAIKLNTNVACGAPVNGNPILFKGYIHVYYNTMAAGGAIQFFRGCSQNVDPSTDIQIVGNTGYLSSGCNPGYGTWHVDYNLSANSGSQATRSGWPPCGKQRPPRQPELP